MEANPLLERQAAYDRIRVPHYAKLRASIGFVAGNLDVVCDVPRVGGNGQSARNEEWQWLTGCATCHRHNTFEALRRCQGRQALNYAVDKRRLWTSPGRSQR